MSDLVLNLPHYTIIDIYSDLRSADNRHDCRPHVSFTGFAFYIAVRCGFVKHLYLTSCLNAHNHNPCIRLPQTGCTLLVKIAKYKYLPLMPWQPP